MIRIIDQKLYFFAFANKVITKMEWQATILTKGKPPKAYCISAKIFPSNEMQTKLWQTSHFKYLHTNTMQLVCYEPTQYFIHEVELSFNGCRCLNVRKKEDQKRNATSKHEIAFAKISFSVAK